MSHKKHHPQPIAPDSVHLWRGYNIPGKPYADFVGFLGSVFVPACALLQPKIGLHAYIPSLPNQTGNNPPSIPDQTALMFWKTPQAYTDGFNTVAVRAYTNLHSLVYGPQSAAGFPIAFTGQITVDQPYFLINKESDWMIGSVKHLVGAAMPGQSSADFISSVQAWAVAYAASPPANADGALLFVDQDYLLFWEHFSDDNATDKASYELAALVTPYLNSVAVQTELNEGLWSQWSGLTLTANSCLNITLDRS